MFTIESSKGLHYNFAHLALPILVLMDPKKFYGDISGSKGKEYINSIWQGLASRMGVNHPQGKIELSGMEVINDHEVFIVKLPKPTEVPQAFFTAAVFRVKKQIFSKSIESVRYFTLELGRSPLDGFDEYYFCEWVGNVLASRRHLNYGKTSDANEKTFASAITDVLRTNKLSERISLSSRVCTAQNVPSDKKVRPNASVGTQSIDNKPSKMSIPDVTDLIQLAKKYKILIEKNAEVISGNFNIIKDIVHKPWVEFVLKQDTKQQVFPNGAVDAQQYLDISLSFTLRALEIAFVLGREYAEHYKENPRAILEAERFDSISIVESTQNELKRISEYGAFWMMRLDEMCCFAGYIDRATMLTGLDTHGLQVEESVFNSFKDGIVNYYSEILGTNF
jgi:hypothetical protein